MEGRESENVETVNTACSSQSNKTGDSDEWMLDGGMDFFISRGKDGRHCCNYDSTIGM